MFYYLVYTKYFNFSPEYYTPIRYNRKYTILNYIDFSVLRPGHYANISNA
jgi:hypothetical protein